MQLIDKLLVFSISYFLQDCVWSIQLKEYAILLHHICTITVFVGLVGKSDIKIISSLVSVSMLWSEIGALLIHIKYLVQSQLPITVLSCTF